MRPPRGQRTPLRAAQLPICMLACMLACALVACAVLPARSALAAGALPGFAPQANATTGSTTAPTAGATETHAGAETPPGQAPDPDRAAQEQTLRSYYLYMMTLDERLPELYSRRVRDQEALALASMRQMQRRRGLLGAFRSARVYLEELRFTRLTGDPDLARWRVAGTYHVSVSSAFEPVEEDALFVLLPEDGDWKIYERREGGP